MPFPFSLNGPQFLIFYPVFAAALLALHWVLYIRPGKAPAGTTGPALDTLTNDPYVIAVLRAGAAEAIRVAVINLVDRGLLAIQADGLQVTEAADPVSVRRRLDRVILQRCQATPLSATAIVDDQVVRAAAAEIESQLQSQGLLLSAADMATRARASLVVRGLLFGVMAVRFFQAVFMGHTNLMFMMLELVAVVIIAGHAPRARLTQIGESTLSALRTLLQRMAARIPSLAPGGATNEVVLVAAMFGLYALPAKAFPFVAEIYPQPSSSGAGGISSESGSSCGSGGCGSCGGCGGCGSD